MSKIVKSILWGTISLMAFIGFGATWINFQFNLPQSNDSHFKIIELPKGASLNQIAATLENKGLIRNRHIFTLMSLIKDRARTLKAGEYRLSLVMSPANILDILAQGKVVQHALTIPEGYSLREIAKAIDRAGFDSTRRVESIASNLDFLEHLQIPANSVEGYLFPETYYFPKKTTPKKILTQMVQTFRKKFTPEMAAQAKKKKLTIHQVVTLASIIERETAIPKERTLIAAVFLNRLKQKMRLQADPTVLYALKRTSGPLTRKELKVNSPYNTYQIRGLPPGPIASPSLESLAAVLYPAPADYLYFVARGDGSHIFSRTLAEHLKAVAQYRKSQTSGKPRTLPVHSP